MKTDRQIQGKILRRHDMIMEKTREISRQGADKVHNFQISRQENIKTQAK